MRMVVENGIFARFGQYIFRMSETRPNFCIVIGLMCNPRWLFIETKRDDLDWLYKYSVQR